MALNAHLWKHYFRVEFSPQIEAIVNALRNRVIPGFEGIEQEAEQVSEEAWKEFMQRPGTGEEDPGDFAEDAEQAGVSYYILISGIRQGLSNLFAAALYHAFEQQVMFFHRRELLNPDEENDSNLFTLREFCSRLAREGIDVERFESWATVKQLRLVANVVKHAEGRSATELGNIRPDLFVDPHARELEFLRSSPPRVFQPLVGEDLYVALEDVDQYGAALKLFWTELSSVMART